MATSSTFKKYTLGTKKEKKRIWLSSEQTDGEGQVCGESNEEAASNTSLYNQAQKHGVSVFGGDEEMKHCQMSRVFSYRRFHFFPFSRDNTQRFPQFKSVWAALSLLHPGAMALIGAFLSSSFTVIAKVVCCIGAAVWTIERAKCGIQRHVK